MSVVPHDANQPESGPEENAQGSPSVPDVGNAGFYPPGPGVSAGPASKDAAANAAELEAVRSQVAERIAGLADKTAGLTKQATSSALEAGKVGLAKAAKIGRETVIPKVRERTRPDRIKKDYRDFLLWLHANVLDSAIERLFFVPTKGHVPLAGLNVHGNNKASGHDYKPTPNSVFKWALAAVAEEDIGRMSFVDYGAGKGRVMLLASQYPFTQVGGIEFAEELHDNATMNIAQFPRSRMKCRNVECVLDDVVNIRPLDDAAVHYFFNPFGPEIFTEVLKGIVASYHARPRRLYVILIDMDAAELMHKTGVFQEVKLPPAERMQAQTLSPYTIAVYRSLA
ncbi:MAG TPA: hypothetical protein VLD66_01560 [Methyloceanibacter sp.]|nr:hypothetical protein [Methyloceanibacter sp.]